MCVLGHYEGVDFLVRRFNGVIDVNVRNASGLTPLMKAALQGRTKCARRLLSAGTDSLINSREVWIQSKAFYIDHHVR